MNEDSAALFEAVFGRDDEPIDSFLSIVERPRHQALGGQSAGAAVDAKLDQSLAKLLAAETCQSGVLGQVRSRLREVIAASAPTGACDPDIDLVCTICALPFQSIYGLENHRCRCRAPNILVLEVDSGRGDSDCEVVYASLNDFTPTSANSKASPASSLRSNASSVSTKRRVAGSSQSDAKISSKKQNIKLPKESLNLARITYLLKASKTADECDPFGISLTIPRYTAKSRAKPPDCATGSSMQAQSGSSSAVSQQQLSATTPASSSSKTQPTECKVSRDEEAKLKEPCVKPSNEKINNPEELTPQDLAEIFKCLPFSPYALELKKPTALDIARLSWDKVEHLDLSSFSESKRSAIIKRCPNLQTVLASKATFAPGRLHCLASLVKLSRIRFYGCEFRYSCCWHSSADVFEQLFSGNFSNSTTLEELVLCNAYFKLRGSNIENWSCSVDRLPVSLKRLQLSGLKGNAPASKQFLCDLERLQHLECLIVTRGHGFWNYCPELGSLGLVGRLRNLTELCLSRVSLHSYERFPDLPKLEVLFVGRLSCSTDCMRDLITARAALRILVITGRLSVWHPDGDDDAHVPKPITSRRQDASAADSAPVLYVFLGERIVRPIQFEQLPADIIVRRIDWPLAKFIMRADIEPIFENVWIAEQIKEAAKHKAPFLSCFWT